MELRPFIRLSIVSILMIVPIVQASAQTPQRDNRLRTASISGRVTVSEKAAANARVSVIEIRDRPAIGNQGFSIEVAGSGGEEDHVVLTDAEGRYRATGLPEGKYEVRALLGNCVREKTSPKASPQETISLDEGESRENVDFALVRGGVITGRVTDANGHPLIARVVTLQPLDEEGKKQREADNQWNLLTGSDMYYTDDRGVYRLFGLRAGRYLVSAGGDSDISFVTGTAGKYLRTWHPDTTDESQAKFIEVAAGGEVTGVDIRLGVAKAIYEASGRVVDDETGKPIAGVTVICIKAKGSDEAFDFGGFGGNSMSDDQGNFRISGLTPGQYQVSFADQMSFLTGGGSGHYSDVAKFEILSANVTGVEIRARRGATISGIVVIGDADPSAKSSLAQTMIMATPPPPAPDEAKDHSFAIAMTPAVSRIGSDGAFSLKGVRPGRITITATSIDGGELQITRIERGGVELNEGIIVTGREDITGVRIVLEKGSGAIRGRVQIAGGALPEGWRMFVTASNEKGLPAGGFGGSSGYAEVDGKGRFVIQGLLPGEYQVSLTAQPPFNPNSPPVSNASMPASVTQKVIVAKGQEAQVVMTLDLSKKNQEEKQ